MLLLSGNGGHDIGIAEMRQTVFGWSRDIKGAVTNRHPVKVCNCITVGTRDNTTPYVVSVYESINGGTAHPCLRRNTAEDRGKQHDSQ